MPVNVFAVMVAVPVVGPGVKITVACPAASVVPDEVERTPRPLAEKVTFSPGRAPLNVTLAVIVDVVEPAATTVGFAVRARFPKPTVTFTDFDTSNQVTVTVAIPGIVPG